MQVRPPTKIYLGDSKINNAGRGVFALDYIKAGELIERCPIIFLTTEDYPLVKQTTLRNYHFLNKTENRSAIALGFGSLYNHSYEPNATYAKRLDDGFIDFTALRDIEIDAEISVNYNYGNPDDKKKLWILEVPEYKG